MEVPLVRDIQAQPDAVRGEPMSLGGMNEARRKIAGIRFQGHSPYSFCIVAVWMKSKKSGIFGCCAAMATFASRDSYDGGAHAMLPSPRLLLGCFFG